MEFTDSNRAELFNDIAEIRFEPGKKGKPYKYKAYVPKEIWNKWRPDYPLKNKEFREKTFGMQGYAQYKDKLGHWSKNDHKDEERRERYKKRHEPIKKTIDGVEYHAYKVPFTDEFFSYYLLW